MTEAAAGKNTAPRAIVLAAGYGTRLAPVTDHLPKPLLPVGGRPLLDRIADRLREAGITDIAVNSHHLGAIMARHLAGTSLVHFPESDILGTGGALANARGFLQESPHFLVHNGDVLCDVDLKRLLSAHIVSGARATLLLVDWPAVNSVTMGRDGTVRHIAGTGEAPVGRPDDRPLTYAGIGVFAREILADIGPGFSSLIDPLVRTLLREPGSVRGYSPEGVHWDDLGTLGRWLQAPQRDVETDDGFILQRITGHGSDRRFWRLGCDQWQAVAMQSPAEDLEFDRFVAVGGFLAEADLGAPQLLAVDAPEHTLLMEDLGPLSLHRLATATDRPAAELAVPYNRVVDRLLGLQAATDQARAACPLAVDRTLDEEQLRWETSYFQKQFLVGHLGWTADKCAGLAPEFAQLAALVSAQPLVLTHRDFQSQNILLQEGEVRLVDFQGLRLGPLCYDLASLVWDPYVALPAELRENLIARFASGQNNCPPAEVARFTVAAGLQRVMQALGAFGFLGHTKAKPAFLGHIPRGVKHLKLLLAAEGAPALPTLTRLIAEIPEL